MRIITLNKALENKILYFIFSGIALTISFNTIINSIFCIILILFWIVFLEKKIDKKSFASNLILILSAFFIITAIGFLYSNNQKEALFRIQQKTALILFPIVLGTIQVDFNKLFEHVKKYFITGIFLSCLYCILMALFAGYKNTKMLVISGNELVKPLEIYPYILALSCLISIIMMINDLKNNPIQPLKNKIFKIPTLLLIVFFSAMIVLISNRQILILFLLTIIFYAINIVKNKIKLFVYMIGFIISLIFSIIYIPSLNQKTKEIFNFNNKENTIPLDQNASLGKSWNSIAIRKAIWNCSKDIIKSNLIFGVGTGDAQDKLQETYENRQFYFASRYNKFNAHNQYIQSLIANGLIGLVALLITILYPILITKLDLYYLTISICFLFIFLTESLLETSKGIVIFSFLNTILIFYRIQILNNSKKTIFESRNAIQ